MLRVDRRSVTERLAQIGAQLRNARLTAGLSQSEVAARAGVTRQLVSRIETGHPAGEVGALIAVAAALDYQIEAKPPRPPNRGEQAALELIERLHQKPATFVRVDRVDRVDDER